ncbi:hypothetical protein ACFWM7_04310 [Streptomyces sp. NPDC058375]|uniref:hypothetical protein n=1 Tax=Streptomyces sp. NPDC058375 TaxID=3346467 RepID=UPI003656B1C0
MKRDSIRRPVLALLAAPVCLGLITACSDGGSGASGEGADSQVASVETPGVKGSEGSSDADGSGASSGSGEKGVMISMSMTEEEKADIHDAWYACLKAEGVQMTKKGDTEVVKDLVKRQPAAAYTACGTKEPYLDPLYTKDGNPKFAEQTQAWMVCMNREGIEVSGNWDDEFFTFGKVDPKVKNKDEVHRTCYSESYK